MTSKKTDLVVSGDDAVISPTATIALISTAVQNNVDVDKLKCLVDLHEQYERRQAEKAFWKAFASFKSVNIEIPKKGRASFPAKGGMKQYDYDLLTDFTAAVTPRLAENGLSLSWRVDMDSSKILVTVILSHELGHSESMTISAPSDPSGNKNALQAIGSTISYLQRYSGKAILGVAAGHFDDDGQSGGDAADAYRQGKEMSEQHRSQGRQEQTEKAEPDERITKAYVEWLDHFKEGLHTADDLDLNWREKVEPNLEQLRPVDRKIIEDAYNAKMDKLDEAMKK